MRYVLAFLVQLSISGLALAAEGSSGGGGTPSASIDPQYKQAVALIKAHEYAKASRARSTAT